MQAKLNLCDELRARLAKKSFSEATRRSLEEDFRLRFTYNSNAIVRAFAWRFSVRGGRKRA